LEFLKKKDLKMKTTVSLVLLIVLTTCGSVFAKRTAWTGQISTDYLDPANWDDGVPVYGDGAKITDAWISPTHQPTLTNGSAETQWFEVTNNSTLTIGQGGMFTVYGGGDSPSIAIQHPGTMNLEGNAWVETTGLQAAWNANAIVNMSDTSEWTVCCGPFVLGKWDDDANIGRATMTMSGDSKLTVLGPGGGTGDFRIKGNLPGFTANPSSLTMQDNASIHIFGDRLSRVQGYIADGLLLGAEVALVEEDDYSTTIITATGGTIPEPTLERTWKNNAGGSWNELGNWNPASLPNTNAHEVTLGGAISAPSTIFTDTPVTVKSIAFNSNHKYAVAGTGTISLETNDLLELPNITVSGNHEFQTHVNMVHDTTVDVSSMSVLKFTNELTLNGTTLAKIGDGEMAVNNQVSLGPGGTINLQAGTLSGVGTVGASVNASGGTVAPGNSPGMLTIDGNYNQGSGGTLAIEIGSTQAEVDYDVLNILGDASLAGTLSVSLIDGFTPSGGNTFKVLTASGELTDLGLTLGGPDAGLFSMSIDAANDWIMLMTAGAGLAGDYSGNGVVDAADYTIFRDNLGGDSAVLNGNGSGAATVVQADYDLWKQNFGSSGTGSSAAVPEPSSLLLLGLGLAVVSGLRRRS
jgi:hypothetical protein